MKCPLLIGIDAGTSNIKAGLYDAQGTLLRELSAKIVCFSSGRGRLEMDLDRLMADLLEILRNLTGDSSRQVAGIGFSVTSPTVILLDRRGGALLPGITYLDNRSTGEVLHYVEALGGDAAFWARIGNSPSPSTCSAGTMIWLKRNQPEQWRRTWKAGYLNTFLAAQFTGMFAADRTVASYSGLLQLAAPDGWDMDLAAAAGLEADMLPEILDSAAKVGGLTASMAALTGLPEGTPVAIGSADTAAAAFALGINRHGDVFHSMGTSEVLSFCLERPEFHRAFMNRCHIIPGRWLAHGAMSTTGAAISWLLHNIFPEYQSEQQLETVARRAPAGSNGVLFLPYLSGERSPFFDPKASGCFLGVTINTRREDLLRAVYEGAAFGMKQIFKIAAGKWHLYPDAIICIGGGTKSSLAVQTRADVLGLPYRVARLEAAAQYGAALLGGLAAGVFSDWQDLPRPEKIERTVLPIRENHILYEKLSRIYERLYPSLKEAMHDLYEL